MLLLSESSGHDCFSAWRAAGSAASGAWKVEPTPETVTLSFTGPGAERLHVVAGRQVVTGEGLEVLMLGTVSVYDDRRFPAADLIRMAADDGALPVIPWGAGKWFGGRGRALDCVLRSALAGTFALGDNSGRPWFWGNPRHIAAAGRAGVAVLPGSDPLPFAGEEKTAGRYGFILPGSLDGAGPFAGVRSAVLSGRLCGPYGGRESAGRFLCNQLRMQVRRRIR